MVLTRFGWAVLLAVLLSACSMFESDATRKEKAYERYIGRSLKAKERREMAAAKKQAASIPSAPVQQSQDVQTGDQPMPAQPPPGAGTAAPEEPPPSNP